MIYTHVWAPVVGGLQTVTRDLATGLRSLSRSQSGQEIDVTLVTQTPAGEMNDSELPFRVVRRPSSRQLLSLIRSADLLHIANPALVPLALGWMLRKPVVLEHDGYQAACPNGLFLFEPDKSVCPGHYLARRYGKCLQCNADTMGWPKSFRTLLLTFPRRWLARRGRRQYRTYRARRQACGLAEDAVCPPWCARVPYEAGLFLSFGERR
jgi:hypothetical protein